MKEKQVSPKLFIIYAMKPLITRQYSKHVNSVHIFYVKPLLRVFPKKADDDNNILTIIYEHEEQYAFIRQFFETETHDGLLPFIEFWSGFYLS